MKVLTFAVIVAGALLAYAGAPQPRVMTVTIGPYQVPMGGSNCVITVYKSTSLGSVWTPFKPTCVFPGGRTNVNFIVLPGTYRFYSTATVQPFGESDPTITVTNKVQ